MLIHFSNKWGLNSLLSTPVSFIGHIQKQKRNSKAYCCTIEWNMQIIITFFALNISLLLCKIYDINYCNTFIQYGYNNDSRIINTANGLIIFWLLLSIYIFVDKYGIKIHFGNFICYVELLCPMWWLKTLPNWKRIRMER